MKQSSKARSPTLSELRTHHSVEDPRSGCWIWSGPFTTNGYPRLSAGVDAPLYATRYAYELLKGPVPAGHVLRCTCQCRACINPEHRRPITRGEMNTELAAEGRTSRGIVHGLAVAHGRRRSAKLSLETATQIRAAIHSGARAVELARAFDVSRSTIYQVLQHKTWRTADVFRI